MASVTPAILAVTTEELRGMLEHSVGHVAGRVHIDILDGSMFRRKCCTEPTTIADGENAPEIELHLMVQNPLPHIIAWQRAGLPIVSAIIHAEINRPVARVLREIKGLGLDRVLAINPETPVEYLAPHLAILTEAIIMGIHPGASGQKFLGEPILAKIRRARALYPNLKLACDGGVNLDTAKSLTEAGISRLVASSAIWRTADPVAAHSELTKTAFSDKLN